jgi:predicted Zn-dependent peptidase
VVGPLAQAEVADLAQKWFGDVAARSLPPAAARAYPAGPHRLEVRGPVAQGEVTIAVGARSVSAAHPDRPALEVLTEVLRERLLAELRFRRGLTYSPYAYNVFFRDSGYFACQVTVLERHEEWANDTLHGEIEAVKAGGLRKREVRAAARRLQSEVAADAENSYDRAETLADLILDWQIDAALPDPVAAYAAVRPEDVADTLKRIDTPDRQFEGRQAPLFELDQLEAGVTKVVGGVSRLALAGLSLGAARLVWRRLQGDDGSIH